MTKTTREIEKERNTNTMMFAIGVSIIISIGLSILISFSYVDYKLKDVPVKICHNETTTYALYPNGTYERLNGKDYFFYLKDNIIIINGETKEICEIK